MTRSSVRVLAVASAAFITSGALLADQKKLTDDQRVEILRGMTAEYAKCKVSLPRSKKALDFHSDGTWDKQAWADAQKQFGPAGRVGDSVQVTVQAANPHDPAVSELEISAPQVAPCE